LKTLKSISQVRNCRHLLKGRVVFVPTMGALHHGHAALIRMARQIAGRGGTVLVSIFVNPTQFGPKEDFSAYPRPLRNDLKTCRDAGADAVFLPSVTEMYPPEMSVLINETSLSSVLCGRSRAGHFSGVCTIVAKLFHIVSPTHAIFGEKDWQQLAIIRRMVRDLDFELEIIPCPTVREPDGLAASSRNAYLTEAERQLAPQIYAALQTASKKLTPVKVVSEAVKLITKIPGTRIDYIEAIDAQTLQPLRQRRTEGRLAAAVFLGKARLIDNIPLPAMP
jgi:pantoate--beta-alanine ligase